jgi:hypothetical protein
MNNKNYFDFARYHKEQVYNTFAVEVLSNSRNEYVENLTIATENGLVDDFNIYRKGTRVSIDTRRPEIYEHFPIHFGNDFLSPQESWPIYADIDKDYNIIRIFAWHPDIIPFWGNNASIDVLLNYSNNIIITSDYEMLNHRASAKAIRKSIERENSSILFTDTVMGKHRYVCFSLNHRSGSNSNVKNFKIHKHRYISNDWAYCDAFEVYVLPDEVYYSYNK